MSELNGLVPLEIAEYWYDLRRELSVCREQRNALLTTCARLEAAVAEWKSRAEDLLREAVERDKQEAAGVLEQEADIRRRINHALGEALNSGDGTYKP